MIKNKKMWIILICALAICALAVCVTCAMVFSNTISEFVGNILNVINALPIDLNTLLLFGIIILLLRQFAAYVVLIVVFIDAVLRK